MAPVWIVLLGMYVHNLKALGEYTVEVVGYKEWLVRSA